MKITNKMNLPEAVVRAVSAGEDKREGYSATGLLNPPRKYWLTNRYWDEIEVDASDRLWALMGKSVHYILDKSGTANDLVEEGLKIAVAGVPVEGRPDLLDDSGLLSDYKTTSVWSIVYGSRNKEWEQQLNIYAFMYGKAGFNVKKIQVVAMLKDWSKTKARGDDYPKCPVAVVPLKLWTPVEQEIFLEKRVAAFEAVKGLVDSELPECTNEERWHKEDKWAVKKEGRKSAVRVYDNETAAVDHVVEAGKNHSVEHRLGEDVRCKDYCECCRFCSYWKDNVNG